MIFYDRYENYLMAVFSFTAILYPLATGFRYRIAREPYVKGLSRHILTVGLRQLLRYFTVPLTRFRAGVINYSFEFECFGWFVDQGKSEAAIFLACSLHL